MQMQAQPMIAVRDVAQSRAFYERTLGFQSGHGGDEYDQLFSGDQLVLQLHDLNPDMNHEALRRADEKAGAGVLLWFQVDDFEAVVTRLRAAQIAFVKPPFMNAYARHMELWFEDPDGYRIVVAGPSAYGSKALGLRGKDEKQALMP